LQDDGRDSIYYANPPRLELGGTGLVSTAQDHQRFCRMMLNGGTLDGVQILSRKTVALFSLNYLPDGRELADMTLPGLFSGSTYAGVGFSLGGAVTVDRPACQARSANISGAVLPGPRSGSIRKKSWPSSS
jgi:CubicO group peptidase (beta-lactamase class C family)